MHPLRAALLASVACSATLTAIPAHAKRVWLRNDNRKVWQFQVPSGSQSCALKRFQPTTQGKATFSLMQTDTRDDGMFVYDDDGIVWESSVPLTLQVDNLQPWQTLTIPVVDGRALMVRLDGAENSRRLIDALRTGQDLRVTTGNGTRTFSPTGSDDATLAWVACIQHIAAERSGAEPVAPAPRYKPLPAPLPAPHPRDPGHGIRCRRPPPIGRFSHAHDPSAGGTCGVPT